MTGRFKIVGYLVPSGTSKTFKVMYAWDEFFELVARLQNRRTQCTYIFLGQIQRFLLHESIHSYPMLNVEIDQFVNAYSPDRKTPKEILDAILADPKKLEENNHYDDF